MSTSVLSRPTQVGFTNLPVPASIQPGFNPAVSVPHRMPGTSHTEAAPHQMNQLQFNFGVPTTESQLTTRFRKPQPIVIEKISEQSQTPRATPHIPSVYPVQVASVSSSLSSDRLALAVHLAKKDVKKVKELGTDNILVSQFEDTENKHVTTSAKTSGTTGKKVKGKRGKSKTQSVPSQNGVTLRERVHQVAKKQEAAVKKQHEMYFYPASRKDDDFDSDRERNQANEIRKLRKELHQYMKQMEGLRDERPEVLRNKDKRLKRRRGDEVRLSDDDVDHRQVVRSEEQAARSARMLYVLQRQVQEIEDELNKKGRGIKHTKKSQTLSRLAAAHRGAVRALQTFVSHAPLQPKVGHGLPPMYQELSALVRQLSLLATQLHVGGEDLGNELKRMEDKEKKVDKGEKEDPVLKTEEISEKPSAFIQEVAGRKPQDSDKVPTPMKPVVTSSPDPTPERDAILQAGLSALLRAKDTPVQTPVVKPGLQPRAAHFPTAKPVKPVKQALLLPAKLKLKRQRAQQIAKRVKLLQDMERAHFAKETVSSILKKAPPVDWADKPKTPPRTPTKEGPRTLEKVSQHDTAYVSPRTQRRECERQLESPKSPKYPRRTLPLDYELVEREVARQRWLDEEADRRIRELEERRRAEILHRREQSSDVLLSRRLISETEEAIRSRLQPLLDRAEEIADADGRRELVHKKSLHHQLGKLASETTMNQADILAEKVLDDVLEETVVEMQRLEVEEEAEIEADNLQNSSTLENILQRLQNFEKVEEEIRRHWVHVKYSDVEKPTENLSSETRHSRRVKVPKPIVFSKPDGTESHRLKSENSRGIAEQGREMDRRPLKLLEEISDTSSVSSLVEPSTEDRSPTQSSFNKGTQLRGSSHTRPLASSVRPTVKLSVPEEMRASVVSYRNRFNKYLRDTATHEEGKFDPWGLVDRISEDLLEEAIHEVGNELEHVCDDYAEALYNEEFVSVNTDT